MSGSRRQFLQPTFHQMMLAAWAGAATAHGVLMVAANEPPRLKSVLALIVIGVLVPAAMIWYAWRIIDPVLDRLARRGTLQAVWQRLIAACVVTPLVAAPTVLVWSSGYPFRAAIASASVFVPWGVLLVWILSPRRSARFRRQTKAD